jgi:(1->4)-alpha-D-glucan 1-alpha-D-glucosylmutase
VNGRAGDARSFDKLDALIQEQHYRLAFWKVASEEINYRRFFDVTEMVALKMELPEVFNETHRLIFEWLKAGKITGLRIDHPDGLWNPKEYLHRLQGHHPSYVVVEKILSGEEQLPRDWEVEGTTGYDFLNRVNGVFVDGSKGSEFDAIYREFTGGQTTFSGIVYNSRKQVLERSFQSELNALTHRLRDLAAGMRGGRDFTFSQLRRAAIEIIANFPVYRTYVNEASAELSQTDREVIRKAVQEARGGGGSEVDAAVFDFIERFLQLDLGGELDEGGLQSAREFVMKFQQLTGPAMAKGLEDTAFYRFNRLISLNEVGGDPGKFGVSPQEFHASNSAMMEHWPHTMLASTTHDTKRGEDVRARLNVLSEMPAEWRKAVVRWSQLNRNKKTLVGNALAPDANDEYLLYQTLVGAWPDDAVDAESLKSFCARVVAFMLKAAKEAKVNTNWTEPNAAYEKALRDFVERVLADGGEDGFVDDARRFAHRLAFFGRFNSLAQTLLKIASPGVPDFYQGSEIWDLNLVDPDNRRPVDYSVRRKLLSDLKEKFGEGQDEGDQFFSKLLGESESGAMKLFLIWRALKFRGTQRELFDGGNYVPVLAQGRKRDHLCAFTRAWKDRAIVVVVPRLVFELTQGAELSPIGEGVWHDTLLPLAGIQAGRLFRNLLTRERVASIEVDGKIALNVGQVLKTFPVALLEKI